MKKTTILIATLLLWFFGQNTVFSQNVNIPDANFKNSLLSNLGINTNSDTEIQVSEAEGYTEGIFVNGLGISDLTGIEAFINITMLSCSENNLTEIDISSNTSLTILECTSNTLSSLVLTNNVALTELSCNYNSITSLDLSNNPNLTYVRINGNSILTVDLSANTVLDYLDCSNNTISSLDLSNNTVLDYLDCSNNNISSLDLSNNTALTYFACPSNSLSELVITNNVLLSNIDCSRNLLTSIDFATNTQLTNINCERNNITAIDVSNNLLLLDFNCAYNQLTEVDIASNSALVTFDVQSNYYLSAIDVSNNLLLKNLKCGDNNITSLDISSNPVLERVLCWNTDITSLSIANNPEITVLYCNDCLLADLDLRNGNNTEFVEFSATNNPDLSCISVDDVAYAESNFTSIDEGVGFNLDCSQISNVSFIVNDGTDPIADASVYFNGMEYTTNALGEILIESISAGAYNYSVIASGYEGTYGSLYVTGVDIIETISLVAGNLAIVYIPDVNLKTYLLNNPEINLIGDNEIQVIEAENFTGQVNVYQLSISDMTGIEAFINITDLDCGYNNISELDVSSNTALVTLNCFANHLTELDLSQNTALGYLNATNNSITSLDLRLNPNIIHLICVANQLQSLDMRNGYNTNIVSFSVPFNNDLSCISVDNVAFSIANWSDGIDEGVNFSLDCSATKTATFNVSDGTNPIENALVNLDGADYYTDASGTVMIYSLESNDYNYSVSCFSPLNSRTKL